MTLPDCHPGPASPVTDAPKVVCREIREADLDAVADLLTAGFAERSRGYWLRGLGRMRDRDAPPGFPRYGMMLDRGGKPVGVILLLFSAHAGEDPSRPRCNLSSWYVDPAYGSHVASLVLNCLRRKAVTYTNLSAARHTQASVEAIKFLRYTTHYFVAVPALARRGETGRLHVLRGPADAAAFPTLPERGLLADHAAMGCLCLVLERGGELHPFVFQRFRAQAGRIPLPMRQLIFTRHMDEFVRFAGKIGRFLARRGTPFIVLDSNGERWGGLPGFTRRQGCAKYYRGPDRPRLGDLAYSERVIFGP